MGNEMSSQEVEVHVAAPQLEAIIGKSNSNDALSDASNTTLESVEPSVERDMGVKRVSVVRFAEPYVSSVKGEADHRHVYSEASPLPDVFQIIRMGHEVIRGNLIDVEAYMATNELEKAFDSFERLCKWSRVYMKMHVGESFSGEDDFENDDDSGKGLFAVLDKNFDNITQEHHMRQEVRNLGFTGEKFASSLKLQSKGVKAEFLELKEMILNHLGRKEAILMPKMRKLKADDKFSSKQIMRDDILSLVADSPEFKFFIQHANHHLDKHGHNKPKARMFDHALWYCATGSQWKKWHRWIKGSVRSRTCEEVEAAISF